jgi:hypothetical protein
MQTLDVVNAMLGTMGEAPLNSLEDAHALRGSCMRVLNSVNRRIQGRGWWFNREYLTLSPGVVDSSIYLPGDTINVRADRMYLRAEDAVVGQRASRLYNMDGGTYVFDHALDVELVRLVPFDSLPELAAAHIGAQAVLEFQTSYDGDSTKTRQLALVVQDIQQNTGTRLDLNAEETRQSKANWKRSNYKLQYLKSIVRGARSNVRTRW